MSKPNSLTTEPIFNIDVTIDVNKATVNLTAQPTNIYLFIYVANHWITNLLDYYNNKDDDNDIHYNQT
jgi:hypothetical protein